MNIETIEVGLMGVNCYILRNGDKCVVIDPGDDADRICEYMSKNGCEPVAILLTHGHFDHIGAVDELVERFGNIRVYAAKDEKALLNDPALNCTARVGRPKTVSIDTELQDGQMFTEAGIQFNVLATPGHTAGSICFQILDGHVLFSGDTLFKGSMGRTDLPTGDGSVIFDSLRELASLPDDYAVYPGHGSSTTIGEEKRNNPFMNGSFF